MLDNINLLLIPISIDKPAGDNLEEEPIYDQIRQLRESDPQHLIQDDWSLTEPKKANWGKVLELCEISLTEQTKDLQIASWLVESLCHEKGLEGVCLGFEFLSEFIARFWFNCWPSIEGEGDLVRRSKLSRLDRDLSQQLICRPLLEQKTCSLEIWRKTLAFEQKVQTNPSLLDDLIKHDGDFTMANFDRKARQCSSIEISKQASAVESIMLTLGKLEECYFSLSQDKEGQIFVQTSKVLLELAEFLQRLTQRTIPILNEEMTFDALVDDNTESIPYPIAQTMTRELAINQMLSIAAYFRLAEPSSPVPFLMERGARWASMTLTEWLDEMLNDSNVIQDINNVLTGVTR